MADLKIGYDPNSGTCACGENDVDTVHVVIDGTPSCPDCAQKVCDDGELNMLPEVAEGIFWFDVALRDVEHAGEVSAALVKNVLDIAHAVARERVHAPVHAFMSDKTFAAEVFTRATRTANPNRVLDAVNEFTDLTQAEQTEVLRQLKEESAAKGARSEARLSLMAIAHLVFERAGVGPDAKDTLGDAAGRLGIDLDLLVDAITVKCAEHGTSVDDLPAAVVDDCFTAANPDGGVGQ